ncbi:MAG: 16S rRNA (cytosine(1402)-N(4))-methyltransferase RsmH [bacterium]|nr:16S rRNA (cytosine(1402)-N(4))-methyltransferase RsmH [bacterium]
MEFSHKSVLLNEAIESLQIKPDGIYIDGTAGGAGHSTEIAKKLSSGRLIAIDRDPDAVEVATKRLKGLNATVVQGNFTEMGDIAGNLGITQVDGILLDLGTSSWQLDNGERGFSYHKDAPLDMRMSRSGTTAADLVNNLSLRALTDILRKYGEEKFAGRIAASIVNQRAIKKIETTFELSEIISNSVPAAAKRDGHPARKSFQAIRIAVNDELKAVEDGVNSAFKLLAPGGILSIITFHSLEDRIVKHGFAEFCKGCTCPSDFPICVCGNKPRAELVNRKPIIPSRYEIEENARSRSAKLRSVRKI